MGISCYILVCILFIGTTIGQDGEKEEFLTKHQEYRNVIDYLTRMEQKFPDLIQLETIGYTAENRKIVLAMVGTRKGRMEGSKPSLWLDSAMHAREWISVSVTQNIIDTLLKTYTTDNATKDYVDKLTWYILPIMNPDGYEFSRERDSTGSRPHFLWRKNHRRADCSVERCFLNNRGEGCYGVDLNRNFGYHWGRIPGGHTSNDSCDEQYIGPSAFSEKESIAVRDFILSHTNTLKAYFTVHSYAQMWFYPYAYQTSTYPDDHSDLHDVAMRATAAIRNVYGTSFTVGSPSDLYYPASGSAIDWAKGSAGIKYSYGIELRPQRDIEMSAFLVPWDQIEPICKETWAGIKVVADEIIKRYA